MSPSKRLGSAKKLVSTSFGFKMDSTFVGPIVGRSIGGKIYNGPGKNHDILGKVEKDGLVTLTGRTEDRVWISITCGGPKQHTEGWVMASEVDLNFERKSYAQHDDLQHELDPLNTHGTKPYLNSQEHFMYALRETVVRDKPKWSSKVIAKAEVNSKILFKILDETKAWA